MNEKVKKKKGISYAKWGYLFILPFFIVYISFTLIPQLMTFYNSFFENYMNGLKQVGPIFVGFGNFVKLFSPDRSGNILMLKYFGNTLILWLLGAVPQILIALLLAVFFTSYRLNLKGQQFFKTVIYMPNLIMASAFSMLFFTLFSPVGPVNQVLLSMGHQTIDFLNIKVSVRLLVSLLNFLMWFGNTTILLMAGIPDAAPARPDPGLHDHHRDDRRSADVRCAADPDQRQGHAGPHEHDDGHVPEQLPADQQELRHGRRGQHGAVHRLGGAEPVRVRLAEQAV